MGYDITIARISNDLKEYIQINEQDWIDCQVEGKIEYKKQEFNSKQFLEFVGEKSGEFIPALWIENNFNYGYINSSILLSQNMEIEKRLVFIASRLEAIIFGEDGELFYIPEIGLIEENKFLLEQVELRLDELRKESIQLNNNDSKKIRNKILKKKEASR